MLSINKQTIIDKMNTFLDVLNTNGEVNIEWIKTKKAKFDIKYGETLDLLDRYKRNKGKLLKLIEKNDILTPQYIEEYDLEDIKDIIHDNTVTDSVDIIQIDRDLKRLLDMEDRITNNVEELDQIIQDVSTRKGIGNVEKLEVDTFDEHYYDIDRMREERGITLNTDDMNKIESSEKIFDIEDEELDEEFFDYIFDGNVSLKDLAEQVYLDSYYWKHILNYKDNLDIIIKRLGTKDLDYDVVSSDGSYLKGVKIKVPYEIVSYTDEFDTKVLEQIKL